MIDVTRETFAYYISGESAVGIPPRVSADMLRAYDRLRAENEQLRRERDAIRNETLEKAAKVAEPTRPRPCTCDGCDCDKPEDAEDVGRWDAAYAAAAAIRNLKEPSDEH